MAGLNRFLRRFLAVYTILIAMVLCWQCVDLYRDAYSPEMLSDYGTPLERVYTPEKVAVRLRGVGILSAVYPVVLAGVLFTQRFNAQRGRRAVLPPEYMLAQIKKRIDSMPEKALQEEKRRRCAWICAGVVVLICASVSLVYLLDGRNFSSWDLEPVMAEMVSHVAPWLIIAFIALTVASACSAKSAGREMEILKSCPRMEKAAEENMGAKTGSPAALNAARFALLAIAIVFILLGVINGDPRSILTKAIRICTECIGLG